MGNTEVNNARHSLNCIYSLKTWATENDCDCELGTLRKFYDAHQSEQVIAQDTCPVHGEPVSDLAHFDCGCSVNTKQT